MTGEDGSRGKDRKICKNGEYRLICKNGEARQSLGMSEDVSRTGSVLHPTIFLPSHSEAICSLGIPMI